MGIGGQQVTIVVDVANVMGSRPDGWWRDRAGAAVRLHAEIVRLAASGRAILPDEPGPTAGGAGENGAEQASAPGFVMVLEGAARAAAARLARPSRTPSRAGHARRARRVSRARGGTGPVRPGEVRVVQARARGTTRSWPWCANCPGGAWS